MTSIGLAIDTTFDDTSVSVLRAPNTVLSNLTISQFADHKAFGGIVPERASRKHLEVIHPLIQHAVRDAGIAFDDLDWVAVSNLPGLMGSVLVGLTVAKAMAFTLGIPLIGINHIESHPYACLLDRDDFDFPALHLIVAGGHTLLMLQSAHFKWEIVGRSRDDAAGECADKVARMYGLPMPGGKYVDQLAVGSAPLDIRLPRPMMGDGGFDFSFSGLKTYMLNYKAKHGVPEDLGPLMASFMESVRDVLVAKTFHAADHFGAKMVTVSGGLAASRFLRESFIASAEERNMPLLYPEPAYCTDNASMAALLAARKFHAGMTDGLDLQAFPNLS